MKPEIIENKLGKFKRIYNCMTGKYDLIPLETKQDKPTNQDVDRWYVAYLETKCEALAMENSRLAIENQLYEFLTNSLKSLLILRLNGKSEDISQDRF